MKVVVEEGGRLQITRFGKLRVGKKDWGMKNRISLSRASARACIVVYEV